ncbi:hypothetical protein MMC12_005693 [Toensbergia leucococca]|nr:hypothetical protein [Toensbergia leucococca]
MPPRNRYAPLKTPLRNRYAPAPKFPEEDEEQTKIKEDLEKKRETLLAQEQEEKAQKKVENEEIRRRRREEREEEPERKKKAKADDAANWDATHPATSSKDQDDRGYGEGGLQSPKFPSHSPEPGASSKDPDPHPPLFFTREGKPLFEGRFMRRASERDSPDSLTD